jgi:hypothetical protein
MYVVPFPVVRAQKILHMTSCALYRVCVGACTLVNGANVVVSGAVGVAFRVENPVRSPATTNDSSAGFDPSIYYDHQSVRWALRNGNEKRFTVLALNTSKHPLPLNKVATMIFSPTQLAFFRLDGPFYDRWSPPCSLACTPASSVCRTGPMLLLLRGR